MPESALACCRQLPGNRACCWQPREARRKHAISADRGCTGEAVNGAGREIGKGRTCRNDSLPARKVSLDSRFPRAVDPPLFPVSGKSRRFSSGGLRVARACLYRATARARKASRLTRSHARTRWHPRLPVSLCFPGASTGFPKERINSPGPAWPWRREREGERGLYTRRWNAFPHVPPRGGSFLEAVFLFGPIHYLSASTFICGNHRDAEVSNYNVELRR